MIEKSDTPRTDAQVFEIWHEENQSGPTSGVDPDFARTLERENIALRKDRSNWISNASNAAGQASAGEDGKRLDWMSEYSARISWSRDGEVCSVWIPDEEGGGDFKPFEGYPQKCYSDPRQAIDAAIAQTAKGQQ